MKVISYCIFDGGDELLMNWYMRGLYFNYRMNRLLYPDWTMIFHGDSALYDRFDFLPDFSDTFKIDDFMFLSHGRCYNMLTRMRPVFDNSITHVLCRDADTITTYREMCAVNDWLNSGKAIHGINDNPAHSIPLMGGMIGIDCQKFRELTGINTFEQLVEGHDLSYHGSDQELLMKKIWPKVSDNFFLSKDPIQRRHNKLWESDLTCRHIGSAGVVEMELVRFLQRHDPENDKYVTFEKQYPNLFYWWLP